MTAADGKLFQGLALFLLKDSINNFLRDQGSKDGNILRRIQKAHEADDGIQESLIHRADKEGFCGVGFLRKGLLAGWNEVEDQMSIQIQSKAQVGRPVMPESLGRIWAIAPRRQDNCTSHKNSFLVPA